jgi:branched-chain amino acid transport system substrate-binding protein
MKRIQRVGIVALASFLGAAWAAAENAGPAAGPIKVGCIFSVTGPASYLGAPEKKTVEMLVEKINAAGGVLGRPIQLITKDSEGSPEKTTSFAKQLIEEEGVLAILGPSTSGESLAIKSICEEGKTVLLSCAAAEKIVDPVAPYVFKTAPKDAYAVQWICQTMKELGIKRIGVLVSNDGFGLAGRDQLAKYAPQSGIEIAASEVYDKATTDLTGVLNKIKGQNVQAVVNWSIVPAQALVAKNMKQLGFDVPLFQSHGFGNIRYVQAGGAAANGTIFPAGRLLVADLLPDSHPQKKLLMEYKKDYEDRYHEDASTFGGHAYDALTVLVEGIKKAGSTDAANVRAAIENLQGVPGTAGIFNFSKKDHNGLDMTGFEMLTVKDGKFAFYKRD